MVTEDIMRKAGELGFLGVAVPLEYGGMGMGFVSTMLVCETISGACGSLSTAFGAHTGIGMKNKKNVGFQKSVVERQLVH